MNSSSNESEVGKCVLFGGLSEDVVLKYKNRSHILSQIMLSIFYVFLMFLTAILNAVTVFTIKNSPSLKKNLCYFLVMLQSWCDFTTGLVNMPANVLFIAAELTQALSCQAGMYGTLISSVPSGVSFGMMVALSFERFMSIVHPTFHRNRLTQNHFLIYLSVNIVIFSATTFSSPFWLKLFYMSFTFYRLLSLTTIGYFYVCMYQTTKNRFLQKRQKVGTVDTFNVGNAIAKNKIIRDLTIQKKLAKTCFLTCVAYVCCYLPLVFTISARFWFETSSLPLLRQYQGWGLAISSMNPSLNSVIFFWTRPVLRREMINLTKKFFS